MIHAEATQRSGEADALTCGRGGPSVRKIVILGAAGRDFHDFNMLYRSSDGIG